MKTVNNYKDLKDIAGEWATVNIKNNYILGANNFIIEYEGQKICYQNNDILDVAGKALSYNGLSNSEYKKFYSAIKNNNFKQQIK